ncbi:tRNA adenosine(34) deaminase TadA [Candidatus Zixiibacteriota bacterium]
MNHSIPLTGPDDHRFWMTQALREAERAAEEGEVPVGAVIVHNSMVIGRGYNRPEGLHDATAHAEILAIGAASETLGDWRLEDCTIYVTLEPCPMCAGAIVQARIPQLVYGASDQKAGACGTLYDITNDPRLNHQVEVIRGVMESDSAAMLKEFFRRLRSRGSDPSLPE